MAGLNRRPNATEKKIIKSEDMLQIIVQSSAWRNKFHGNFENDHER